MLKKHQRIPGCPYGYANMNRLYTGENIMARPKKKEQKGFKDKFLKVKSFKYQRNVVS